jgi:hypothetical protein
MKTLRNRITALEGSGPAASPEQQQAGLNRVAKIFAGVWGLGPLDLPADQRSELTRRLRIVYGLASEEGELE